MLTAFPSLALQLQDYEKYPLPKISFTGILKEEIHWLSNLARDVYKCAKTPLNQICSCLQSLPYEYIILRDLVVPLDLQEYQSHDGYRNPKDRAHQQMCPTDPRMAAQMFPP
jgi:hypothetical protein